MVQVTTKQGICSRCDTPITPGAIGYCYPCATIVHEELDKEFPFEVLDGSDMLVESFRTKEEADDFVWKMRRCYVNDKLNS